MPITIEEIEAWIQDLWEQYQREEEQAILQRNMDKAIHALAGKESCLRLRRHLALRKGMADNLHTMNRPKRRA